MVIRWPRSSLSSSCVESRSLQLMETRTDAVTPESSARAFNQQGWKEKETRAGERGGICARASPLSDEEFDAAQPCTAPFEFKGWPSNVLAALLQQA